VHLNKRKNVVVYLVIASMFLTLSLAFSTIGELRQEVCHKKETIEGMNVAKEELEEEIELLSAEKTEQEKHYQEELDEQEQDYEEILKDYREEKEDLKEIIYQRYETYQTAVNMEGDQAPVLNSSGFTAGMFERVWNNFNASNLKGSGEEFIRAERETGVNALVLASIAVHEAAWGDSQLAREKNNFFGWTGRGGFDDFSTREESIMTTARTLQASYLSRAGSYYHGDNLEAINIRYAEDPEWHAKVADTMETIARHAVINPWEKDQILN